MPLHPATRPAEPIEFLRTRRSASPAILTEPAPTDAQVAQLLEVAARTPDHGKLVPYRFVVLDRQACVRLADVVGRSFADDNPAAPAEAITKCRHRFESAPMIVAVVCRAQPNDPRKPNIPEFEQLMTCGAVCMNLLHAAHAMGFGAVWLSGWTAYDERVLRAAGLDASERLAGWIHVGTQTDARDDRERPDLGTIVSALPTEPEAPPTVVVRRKHHANTPTQGR